MCKELYDHVLKVMDQTPYEQGHMSHYGKTPSAVRFPYYNMQLITLWL